ncbi:hypothetical protein DQ04_15821000 [Trypanosoma grayi]|uniref:hypothetical protein n=1 Tax=Trypanosoma grayi TaxID=71804 RepID=UPI0004F3F8A1|nr:hypothetical protein DQ04_15821000 [Trypanosoma grayi]KEG06122.1 hypothetical protein DQ04_15821000 [Trypanosoma grayi]
MTEKLKQRVNTALDKAKNAATVAVNASGDAEELLSQTETEAKHAKETEAVVRGTVWADEDEMLVMVELVEDNVVTAVKVSLQVKGSMEKAINAATAAENAQKDVEKLLQSASTEAEVEGSHTANSTAPLPGAEGGVASSPAAGTTHDPLAGPNSSGTDRQDGNGATDGSGDHMWGRAQLLRLLLLSALICCAVC